MKNRFKLLKIMTAVTVFLVSTATTCEDPEYNIIYFENVCGERITVFYNYYLPDSPMTSYEVFYQDKSQSLSAEIRHRETKHFFPDKNMFDAVYMLRVYKQSTLDTIPQRRLIEHNICDTLYILTQEELSSGTYNIRYTGDRL